MVNNILQIRLHLKKKSAICKVGREPLLTHTHGAEVTAGATLVGKNRASHQKNNMKTVSQTEEKGVIHR